MVKSTDLCTESRCYNLVIGIKSKTESEVWGFESSVRQSCIELARASIDINIFVEFYSKSLVKT